MEIAVLAATVVRLFLIPLFSKGEEGLTDGLAKSGGEAAAGGLIKTAETIWNKIKSRFSREDEKNTVQLFEKSPEAMDKMLIELLEKRLEEDDNFHQEIQRLVDTPVAGTGETSWQLMGKYVGAVDARNATISRATVAGVYIKGDSADQSADPGASHA